MVLDWGKSGFSWQPILSLEDQYDPANVTQEQLNSIHLQREHCWGGGWKVAFNLLHHIAMVCLVFPAIEESLREAAYKAGQS